MSASANGFNGFGEATVAAPPLQRAPPLQGGAGKWSERLRCRAAVQRRRGGAAGPREEELAPPERWRPAGGGGGGL